MARSISLDHPLPRPPRKTLKSRAWCILERRADPKYGPIYLIGSSAPQAPTQNPNVPGVVYPRATTGPQVWRNASHWIIRSTGLHAKPYSSRHGVSQGDEQTSSMARSISLDHPLPNPRRKTLKSRAWCILGRRADPKYGAVYLTGSSAPQAPTQIPKVPGLVYPRTTTGPYAWRDLSHWIIRYPGPHAKP